MARKRWRHDGPQLSSAGWSFSAQLATAISKMSREADAVKCEIDLVRNFLQKRPDLRRDAMAGRLVWQRVLELAVDDQRRQDRERQRRREIALRHIAHLKDGDELG